MPENLTLYWQPTAEGARLLQACGSHPCPVLPDTVEGHPITEIGRYCFSASRPDLPADARCSVLGEGGIVPLAGNALQQVTLPAPVLLLDSAAFYNCRRLTTLTVGSALREVGSDEFSNCFSLRRLVLDAAPDAPTGLRRLLTAVSADLQVEFSPGGCAMAQLYYPEYSEQIDENAPAHVFNHTIYGEGYRYRQCFTGDVLNCAEYDATFEREKAAETPENMCCLCLGRLRLPYKLSEAAALRYREYLRQNAGPAVTMLVKAGDTAALEYLCREGIPDAAALQAGLDLAVRSGAASLSALLLDWQHRLTAPQKKTYDFDF